jgi:hypothetical protein
MAQGAEVETAAAWLLQTVRADTGAGGLRNPTTPLVKDAYEAQAPEGSAYPLALFQLLSAVDDGPIDTGLPIGRVPMTWRAVIVGQGAGLSTAVKAAYARLHSLLQGRANVPQSGQLVGVCYRLNPYSEPETDVSGTYRVHGGEYRLTVHP